MRLGSDDYVTYDDVVSSDTCSILSTPYTTSNFMDFMTNKGGEKDMMGLYEVFVVDTKAKHVVTNERVIAKDADKAKLSVAATLNPQAEFPEHLEFFVRCIGEWKDERPKEVKIVKEE